jgi:hypothetical protein
VTEQRQSGVFESPCMDAWTHGRMHVCSTQLMFLHTLACTEGAYCLPDDHDVYVTIEAHFCPINGMITVDDTYNQH